MKQFVFGKSVAYRVVTAAVDDFAVNQDFVDVLAELGVDHGRLLRAW